MLALRYMAISAALSTGYAGAGSLQYGQTVELIGKLSEREATDCCIDGHERKVQFPALDLRKPIDVNSPEAATQSENPELGVRVLHLVIAGKEHWAAYRQRKGQLAKISCSLFHAQNGHHLTPVMCSVKHIGRYNGGEGQ